MGKPVHTQEINEYPDNVKAEFVRLSDWVRQLRRAYGQQVVVRIVDPQSLNGFWKVVRHRIRRFPTFFVGSREKIAGWEGDPDAAVRRVLAARDDGILERARV